MVDVGEKTPAQRTAAAARRVRFPPAVSSTASRENGASRKNGLRSPKGDIDAFAD
jgi:hypothetical protein